MKTHLIALLISASLLVSGCDAPPLEQNNNNNQFIIDDINHSDQVAIENSNRPDPKQLFIPTPFFVSSFILTILMFNYLVSAEQANYHEQIL